MEVTIDNEVQQAFGPEEQYDPWQLLQAYFRGELTVEEFFYWQNTDRLRMLGPVEKGKPQDEH